MNQTLTRWLTCGAWAAGSVALAQEPAAKLLPVRAVDAPPPAVVRAAPPPAYQFQAPASVPAPGYQRPQPQPQYQPPQQPQYQPPQQPQPQPSLWGGVKSMFAGKPEEPPPPPVQQPQAGAKSWWPSSEPPQAQPAKPPQGLDAGPPAYRWYGYGTPTAGANPYAPAGRYPQAADGWFAQTGATPGAFPVPVGGMPVTPREQPVVVHAFPQEPPRPVGGPRPVVIARTSGETTDPTPVRTVVAETPRTTTDRREPQMPIGVGVPVMPSGAGTPVTADPNSGDNEVSWQPAPQRVPIAASTPGPLPVPVAPTEPGTDWGPSRRPVPTDAPPPSVSVTRGQAPNPTAPDLDTAVRSACFGRASRVGITRPGPQRLHVTLVVPTEADARDAAAVVSRLPEVKAYSVTFEAVIGK